MGTYRYNYEDWVKGEVDIDSLEELVKAKHLSEDDWRRIRTEQEVGYSYYIALKVMLMKIAFYNRYESSFAKEELLNQQLKGAERDVQRFKEEHPKMYFEAINGIDKRFDLTPAFILNYVFNPELIDELEQIIPTHTTFYIKSTFLKWLKWLKAEGPQDEEPSFEIPDQELREEVKLKAEELSKVDSEVTWGFMVDKLGIKERLINQMAEQMRSTLDLTTDSPNVPASKPPKSEPISYLWQDDPKDELPKLYRLMKGKFLHKDCTLKQFKSVFSGKPLNDIDPLKWHDTNGYELLYFVMQLVDSGNVDGSLKRMDYMRLKACFVMPNGKPFSTDFKDVKQKVKKELSSEKQKAIDEIISQFF